MSVHPPDNVKNPGHGLAEGIHKGSAHVMPIPVLLGTFAALIFFTILTVVLAEMNLGEIDIWVAMAIATVKAALVALFFMHMRYEKPFNTLLFVFCFFFATLFLGACLIDSTEYQPAIEQYQQTQETLQAEAGG